MHVCSGKHIFSPSPLSAHWSIVIGLSVSGLVLSFVLGGFCRVTRGREREREKRDRERKKGKRESEGGRENGKDVCKSMSMADSSTKSPDIYSALLTNLKKKKMYSTLSVSFLFIRTPPSWNMLVCACARTCIFNV